MAEELASASDMAASLAGKRPFGGGERWAFATPNLYSKTNVRAWTSRLWKVWKESLSGAGSLASVLVFQANDVIDFRRGNLEKFTVVDADHAVFPAGRNSSGHPWRQAMGLHLTVVVLELQLHRALDDQERLVLVAGGTSAG